jgi:hypothetical protein
MNHPAATDEQLDALAPYAGVPGSAEMRAIAERTGGEIDLYCPVHPDTRRSAQLNPAKGAFYCHAEGKGHSVRVLIERRDEWIPATGRVKRVRVSDFKPHNGHDPRAALSPDDCARWHRGLLMNEEALDWLWSERGIGLLTAKRAGLGLDGRMLKIPVYDPDRSLANIRTYDPSPRADRRKIWSVKGCGSPPQLYPVGVLTRLTRPGASILFCEGEWDALLALQSGVMAVTRTAAARSLWREAWSDLFVGRHVYVCHDADTPGQMGNEIVAESLRSSAASVHYCRLPYPVQPKHGKDVSDLIMDHGPMALASVMIDAERM